MKFFILFLSMSFVFSSHALDCKSKAEEYALEAAKQHKETKKGAKLKAKNTTQLSEPPPMHAKTVGKSTSDSQLEAYSTEVWNSEKSFLLYEVELNKSDCKKVSVRLIEDAG